MRKKQYKKYPYQRRGPQGAVPDHFQGDQGPQNPSHDKCCGGRGDADLKYCKAFISVLGDEKAQEDTMAGLKSAVGFIRKELARSVNLRNTPELIFVMDQSIEYGVNMSKKISEVISEDEARAVSEPDAEDAGADGKSSDAAGESSNAAGESSNAAGESSDAEEGERHEG